MANKYVKKYSMSLAIRKTQTKVTLRVHLSLVRMAIVEKPQNTEEKESLYTVDMNVN
jgi:hypothetical protein